MSQLVSILEKKKVDDLDISKLQTEEINWCSK